MQLRDTIIKDLKTNKQTDLLNDVLNYADSYWWLLGTSGCHLCDTAEKIIQTLQSVEPIDYIVIDITDLSAPLMQQYANSIPVILTPTQRIDYPFSVMDLQQLV